MSMIEAKGVYMKGSGGYARVHLTAELGASEFSIEVDLDDSEWSDQLRSNRFFQCWLDGALYGVTYALTVAAQSTGHWKIRTIAGLLVDTTPSYAAFAGAQAVWNALGFQPPAELLDQMMTIARATDHWGLCQFPSNLP